MLKPGQRKAVRYVLVSVVAVGVSQLTLALAFGALHWSAPSANLLATAVATVPSYTLNRSWVWGRGGRSHLWKEVAPFWMMAFAGLALSTGAAYLAENVAADVSDDRAVQTVIVMAAVLSAFGVLWIVKFLVLNNVLFAAPATATTSDR